MGRSSHLGSQYHLAEQLQNNLPLFREGANKRGNSSRLTQSFHFFLFEPFFSPVNALNESLFRPFLRHLRRYSQFLVRSLPLTYHLVHPKQVGQGE